MKILVVADKTGSAKVKPFVQGNHSGEAFWIGGEKFRITADNRVKIGKKFMEKNGFLRPDGRRALIIDTGARWYTEGELSKEQLKQLGAKDPLNGKYLVQGAKIKRGKPYEKYYSGRTGSRIPADVGTGDEALDTDTLEAFDSRDVYTRG